MLPKASRTVTRNPTCAPAAAVDGRSSRLHAAAAPADTVNVAEPLARSSVADSDWDPACRNVTLNVCWPASAEVNVKLAGRLALASLEENRTVPAYDTTVFPKPSFAVTVVAAGVPAVVAPPLTNSIAASADR